MVPYANPHLNIFHTQKIVMDNQLLETCYSSSSSSSDNFDLNNEILSNKTKPNEVWREIVQEDRNLIPFEQQESENTIEEFLVKAGGIYPQPLMAIDPTAVVNSQQDGWFKLQMIHQEQQQMDIPVQNDFNGNLSTMSSVISPVVRSSITEKTVERRRKRMIKNRESAARSRARKQAYTKQLEVQVSELKQKNSLLKKHKEVLKHLLKHSTSQPRYQLRRTSSSSF